MNPLSSETETSRDKVHSPEAVDKYREVFWGTHEPLRADGSPQKDYRRYVLAQNCARCGRPGGKVQRIFLDGWWCVPGHELSDAYLLPLCEDHDREHANAPNKKSWWLTEDFRPVAAAIGLWDVYHASAERWMWREEAKAKRATKISLK